MSFTPKEIQYSSAKKSIAKNSSLYNIRKISVFFAVAGVERSCNKKEFTSNKKLIFSHFFGVVIITKHNRAKSGEILMLINPLSLTRREKLQKNQIHKKAGLTVGIIHTYIKTFLILCTCSFGDCLSYKKSSQTLTFVQFSTKTHCIAKLFRKEWIYDKLERIKWAHKLYLLNSPEHYPFIFEKKMFCVFWTFIAKR